MQISGPGITTFTAKIKPDFIPQTTFALAWFQTSSGQWYATDRLAAADQYDAAIRLYGFETIVNNFINQIEANRVANSNVVTLTNFNAQEHIFGADIDYSKPLHTTVFMDRRKQNTWKGYSETLKLSLLPSFSFVGGNGSLPPLRFLDIGYDGDADYTIEKQDSYNRTFYYHDPKSDSGSFTGVFTFTDQEMTALRRFIVTNRGAAFTAPTFIGVAYPFGRRTGLGTSTVKLTNFEDKGMVNMYSNATRWAAKLTFVEAF